MLAIKILSSSASLPGLGSQVLEKGAGNRAPSVYAQWEGAPGKEGRVRESPQRFRLDREGLRSILRQAALSAEAGKAFICLDAECRQEGQVRRSSHHKQAQIPLRRPSHLSLRSFPPEGLHIPFCNTTSIQPSGQMFARFKEEASPR